ncbi:MAG: trypsin-like peptidase domain-containing protein [Myxococcota bacterium]|nr:trypsin-like peptidase domain-containing protein [Myxococcota bacterium]
MTRARLLVLVILAAATSGLVVQGDSPASNEEPPRVDPGWRNVGLREGRSAVYIGKGWVLTAAHVGAGDVLFEGVTYPAVPGSERNLEAPGHLEGQADLLVFRVDPAPDLPVLKIRKWRAPLGAPLLLIGFGQGRGGETRWQGRRGFDWQPGNVKRWGTNDVAESRVVLRGPGERATLCFRTSFSAQGTAFESQGALGDSGGAVFAKGSDGRWKLAGVILAVERHPGQPFETAVFGNRTTAADLAFYRPQLAELLGLDAPPDAAGSP